jgi:hypothetical protein
MGYNHWTMGWRFSKTWELRPFTRFNIGLAIRPLAWVLGIGIDISDGFACRDYRFIIGIGPFHFGPLISLPRDEDYPEMEDY